MCKIDKEESGEPGIIPIQVQNMLQEQYSAMIRQLHQEQQTSMFEMEQRLGERIEQQNKLIEQQSKIIEEKTREEKERDKHLMLTFREMQEVKRLILEKRKPWWKF